MFRKSLRACAAALGLFVLIVLVLTFKGMLTVDNLYLALGLSLAMGMSVRFNA